SLGVVGPQFPELFRRPRVMASVGGKDALLEAGQNLRRVLLDRLQEGHPRPRSITVRAILGRLRQVLREMALPRHSLLLVILCPGSRHARQSVDLGVGMTAPYYPVRRCPTLSSRDHPCLTRKETRCVHADDASRPGQSGGAGLCPPSGTSDAGRRRLGSP